MARYVQGSQFEVLQKINDSLHLVLVNNQMIFALDAVCLVCDVLL